VKVIFNAKNKYLIMYRLTITDDRGNKTEYTRPTIQECEKLKEELKINVVPNVAITEVKDKKQ